MIYWKLMIIDSNVTVGVPVGVPREFGLLGGIRKNFWVSLQGFPSVAPPPPPTAYFATLSQFSSRSRAFGKGKETAATQASE